ncbi:MAG: DUF2892 domain-containing protein [Chitinophagaceae bacterium]|nr:MAG: DUF2892 domain-containing protein [Chitinophagaceae bacterium]
MQTNMGIFDRTTRIVVAFLALGLVVFDYVAGATAIVLLILSGAFLLTSLIGFCPLYRVFHISTTKKTRQSGL